MKKTKDTKMKRYSVLMNWKNIVKMSIHTKAIYNGEWTVSSINSVEKTGQQHAKEYHLTTILHHTQKLTQNELNT